jgi:hypothetical protein
LYQRIILGIDIHQVFRLEFRRRKEEIALLLIQTYIKVYYDERYLSTKFEEEEKSNTN